MNTESIKKHLHINKNSQGKDYFVGDIHGQHQLLKQQLQELHFNYRFDRLFSVGDIIDRGPDSEDCLKLLNEPWFFAVIGNHEHMYLSCLEDANKWDFYYSVGGSWLKQWKNDEAKLAQWRALICQKMPFSMTVDTRYGRIGVCHADSPDDWQQILDEEFDEYLVETIIWQRMLYPELKQRVLNIDATVHGHTAMRKPKHVHNQVWLDTFAKSGKLSIYSAEQIVLGPQKQKSWLRKLFSSSQ